MPASSATVALDTAELSDLAARIKAVLSDLTAAVEAADGGLDPRPELTAARAKLAGILRGPRPMLRIVGLPETRIARDLRRMERALTVETGYAGLRRLHRQIDLTLRRLDESWEG